MVIFPYFENEYKNPLKMTTKQHDETGNMCVSSQDSDTPTPRVCLVQENDNQLDWG